MLLRRCAVVFCTLTVAGRLSVSQQQFPTLLVDEACQAAEAEMLPALRSTAQRLFLVGDPRQLPATITSPHAKKADYGRSMPFGHRKRGSETKEMEVRAVGEARAREVLAGGAVPNGGADFEMAQRSLLRALASFSRSLLLDSA